MLWQNQEAVATSCPKNPEEDNEEKQEGSASLTPAKETSVGTAGEAVLSEPDCNFTLHVAAHHRVVTRS